MKAKNVLMYPFDDGCVLYYTRTDRLIVLNATGRLVWEMLGEGFALHEVALAFAQHFDISYERALGDVAPVIAELKQISSQPYGDEVRNAAVAGFAVATERLSDQSSGLKDCGAFRFGESRIRVLSSVEQLDELFFARFRHRLISDGDGAEVLEISGDDMGYRMIFKNGLIEEMATVTQLMSRVTQLLLNMEHPDLAVLAYCHAAAVSRGNHSVLMPGSSGSGKSTLTAFLVANGFLYLGDDIVATGEVDNALLPLPTCLSIKSGSWPILGQIYPVLQHLPMLNRYGRVIRYIEPRQNYATLRAAAAPSAIIFPAYKVGEPTQLSPLKPMQTMILLLRAHVALLPPATEEKLAKFLRFVENTPAYELTYSELPSALKAIEDLLAAQPQE
ncbi:MAG: PqqD family peptide modification chaperone [Candidatus Accumulibacter sp.]|uniref:PqqD family peptide modification chaperone n=1 Tax=Accumulibacter sp. TaxID=2053492 RepID=UPI00258E45E6|nr:PqqD family peptide modification chaperone [Accumulibacter sp.]MBK8116300.1 PqqD family peptide modification chaperone [Accumulibacter sp.]